MGSELEDALRAAAAAAAKARAVTSSASSASAAAAAAGASSPPRRAKRKQKKRPRRRSRSESLASESAGDNDAVQRLEAFKERMFEVGKDAASATFAREAGEDIVQVQWKAKKPATKKGRSLPGGGDDDDDDGVPQLTRARVVAKPLAASQEQAPAVAKKTSKNKKNAANKKAAQPVVHELKVPPPAPLPAPQKKQAAVAQPKAVAPLSRVRDDDALQFSDPSDDDDDATADAAASAKALVAAKVAARKASQIKPPPAQKAVAMAAQPVKRVGTAPVVGHTKANGPTAKSVVPKRNTASVVVNGTKANANRATTVPTQPHKPATAKATAPTIAKAVKSEAVDDDDDAKWDLDALMKNTVEKARKQRKASMSDDDAAGSDEDGHADTDFAGKEFRQHQMHLFSQLIDEAARERWELVEVGRLVRIFAAQWSHKKKKTARFLRRCCPELVSVDFLEGLNIPLTAKQLLKIFERGSGTPVVLMNKIASSVENGNMTVQDEDLQSFVVGQTQTMATNREIVEFLLPLLESLSKVKDVGVLLKAICEHWHLDRTAALVQEILLTPIFDDLDGQPDVILEDFPALEGRLDFPSCMDDEDADENGNLEGLIAGEDSDLGESDEHPDDVAEEELGEILSDDAEGEDSHAEDEVYEGETDSEEEREAQERLNPTKRRRSRFILDEADEDEDEEEDDDGFVDDDEDDDDDSEDSSGDSSDDDKPQRKRLRQG